MAIIPLAIVIISAICIFSFILYSHIMDGYEDAGLVDDATAAKAKAGFDLAFKIPDYLIVIIMISLIVGIGVTSYKISSPPVFFVLMLLFAPLLGLLSYFFNYIFIEITNPSVVSAVMYNFPLTMVLCTNLHWVMLLAIGVASVTLYSKRSKGEVVG